MAYPLQPLLSVRIFREDNAKVALHAAQAALLEAEEQAEASRVELARYIRWLPEEKERRYAAIMGEPITLPELDTFKAGLALLDDGVTVREEQVFKAENVVTEHEDHVLNAQAALLTANKEKLKIETHKDIWSKEFAKEAERIADLELEEFSPRMTLSPFGHAEES